MPAIITRDIRYQNARNFEEAFSEISFDNVYLFIGKESAWAEEQTPDTPKDSLRVRIQAYKDIIAMKKISSGDITPVIRNIAWVPNTVYDQFDDTVDMIEGINPITIQPYNFYVITDEYNIYKCIGNNIRGQSTTKPTGTSVTAFTSPDGYKWKYMGTVSVNTVIKYASDDWIPVRTLNENDGSAQWTVQTSAVDGTIDKIEIVSGGSGYDHINPPAIVIGGSGGTGATATPVINPATGAITKILISNNGSGYTTTTVTIDSSGTSGSGCVARAVISPFGGHGSNIERELGAKYRLLKVILSGDESGNLPVDVDYRQMGLLLNPKRTEQDTVLSITSTVGVFESGSDIVGQNSGATATVVQHDYYKGKLYVRVTSGSFNVGETINDQILVGITATVGSKTVDYLPFTEQYGEANELLYGSGDIIYLSNRTKITRIDVQDEEIRFTIQF